MAKSVLQRVVDITREQLGVNADVKITAASAFLGDADGALGGDSLDVVELVMRFEEEFGVEISDDASQTIATVGDAVAFLEKATASKAA
jgi:acyl carrier protein